MSAIDRAPVDSNKVKQKMDHTELVSTDTYNYYNTQSNTGGGMTLLELFSQPIVKFFGNDAGFSATPLLSSDNWMMHQTFRNNMQLHSVGVVEDHHSDFDNNGSSRDKYGILSVEDVRGTSPLTYSASWEDGSGCTFQPMMKIYTSQRAALMPEYPRRTNVNTLISMTSALLSTEEDKED